MAATMTLVGSGTTTNPTLLIQDSSATTHFSFTDAGVLSLTTTGGNNSLLLTATGYGTITFSMGSGSHGDSVALFFPSANMGINYQTPSNTLYLSTKGYIWQTPSVATGSANAYSLTAGITAASGSSVLFSSLLINPTYNTTGAFSGSLIGIDYNPTNTSLTGATHLSFRATSGSVLVGGTTLTNASTLLDLQSSSQALLLTRVATEGNITSAVDGMVYYNSSLLTFRGRQNGSWVNLGGGGISTVGTIDSQTPSVNGLVISGSSIYAQSAGSSQTGMVIPSAQSFSGIKTFINEVIGQARVSSQLSLGITLSSNANVNSSEYFAYNSTYNSGFLSSNIGALPCRQ